MHTFDEIGIRPEESLEDAHARAKAWMEDALAQKKKIMGFGHRVYKHGDSRVPTMKAALDKMIAHYGRPELLGAVQRRSNRRWTRRKGIKPNLDYPSGPTYHLMGFDTPTFTPAVRRQPHHRLDRAHHGAAGLELADPSAERIQRRRGTAPAVAVSFA